MRNHQYHCRTCGHCGKWFTHRQGTIPCDFRLCAMAAYAAVVVVVLLVVLVADDHGES